MEKEGSTEENITNSLTSLSAEKLDSYTLAIQKEEQGEPSKDMNSLSISSAGPNLDYNHGEDKTGMSGNLNCKDQGDKLDTDQSHSDMGGKSNNSRDSKSNTQERELDSKNGQKNPAEETRDNDQSHSDMGEKSNDSRDSKNKTQQREMDSKKGQKNPADNVESNAKEENLDNDLGDKLVNDRSHRGMGGKNNDSTDSKYITQEIELDSKKGQKIPDDKVESNAKKENLGNDQEDKLENDQIYREMGGKSSDHGDSKYKVQEIEWDTKKGQEDPADKVESSAKEENLDRDEGDKLKNDIRDSKYNTREIELDLKKGQKNHGDTVESNSKTENLDNDQSHRGIGEKSSDSRDSKTQERELDSREGQKSPDVLVGSNAEEENLDSNSTYLESKAQKETDKVFGEEKEPELVVGTGVLEMEANTSMPVRSLDPDLEAPGVVEKAVALKNFIKVKSVVAVTSFLCRFSGNSNEDGPYVADDADKNFSDSIKDSEAGDASQKTLETSAWNPLSFIKTNQVVDGRNKAEDANDELTHPIAMKGRIILYTRLGCQDCKDARLFLYWKKLRYTEINIDVYPSRKQELEKFSGSSAVPKVFFNEVLIGGLSELKGLEDSGKLDEKIDYLVSEAPSFGAPLPPLSGEDDISNSGAIDELALIVRKMKEFVVVKDRFYKMRRFTKSFSGSEAVDFLSEDQYLEREEAVEFGRKLARELFFQHVLEENLFEDGNHLYRFLDDDPVVSQCHNIPKGIIDVKPKPIIQIESRLRFIMCAILEAYVSEDGKHIDYRSIHGSEEFARYLRTVEELHRVELQDMRREDKLAFFINLYNMMAIHAILVWGHPDGSIERRKMFGDFKYVIGGSAYSLSDIQNGILRGNQRPPYNLMKPFNPKDKRAMMALPYAEPLIHFALVFGTRSGPVLQCYSPGDIDKELMEAARSFLRNGGLIIDFDTKVASATKILKWFSIDFGKNEMEVLKHSSNYLEPAISEALLELLAISQVKVIYQPYDWGLNC